MAGLCYVGEELCIEWPISSAYFTPNCFYAQELLSLPRLTISIFYQRWNGTKKVLCLTVCN